MRLISVVGSKDADLEEEALAHQVGRLLARAGWGVVCGGGTGVMRAVCEGAKLEGGTTVGILPGTDPSLVDPSVDVAIPTGMRDARNAIVALAGEAVIAVGGGAGTLSEIGLALKNGRPVVGLRTWRIESPKGEPGGIIDASSPEAAVALATEAAQRSQAR